MPPGGAGTEGQRSEADARSAGSERPNVGKAQLELRWDQTLFSVFDVIEIAVQPQ